MRRKTVLVMICGLALAAVTAGCGFRGVDESNPQAVAKEYFGLLRDLKVDKAMQYATFESDEVKQVWQEQVDAYVARRKKGARQWWGDPFKIQEVPGEGGRWAVLDVQWRFKTDLGWQMGDNFSYVMRTVDDKWRVVIDQRTIDMGRPFYPADL